MLQRQRWLSRWMAPSTWRASKQPGTLQRDAFLASKGLRVLGFDDPQVLKEIEGVMGVIFWAVSESLEANPPLTPLSKRGERDCRSVQGDNHDLRDLRLLSRTPGARRRVELTLPSRAHGVVLVRDWHEEPGGMPVEVPE